MADDNRRETIDRVDREGRRNGSWSTAHNRAIAACAGVHDTDWDCLDALDWSGPTTIGKLAEYLGLSSGAMTAVVDRLETAGMVRRERDPDDRRKVIVVMRREGLGEIGAVFQPLIADLEALYGSFTTAELQVVARYLEGVTDALARSTEHFRQAARQGDADES